VFRTPTELTESASNLQLSYNGVAYCSRLGHGHGVYKNWIHMRNQSVLFKTPWWADFYVIVIQFSSVWQSVKPRFSER